PAPGAPARGRRPRARARPVRARRRHGHAPGDREGDAARARLDRGGRRMSDVTFDAPAEVETEIELPSALPVLPLKETVVFPQSMTPLAIGQERSIRLIDDVVAADRLVALVTARAASAAVPGWDDIYEIGTVAVIHKMIRVPDGTLRILVGGLQRIRILSHLSDDPYLVAEIAEVPDENEETPEVEALVRNVQGLFSKIIALA